MHMMIASANKVVKMHDVDHVVFAVEGRNNWRKDFYPPYKKQRADERQKRTEAEIEEEELYFEVYNNFLEYLKTKTNCSVISCENAEADDVIARWIALHPEDEHVIMSSDGDFYQLISDKVIQYNGIAKQLITLEGFFDDFGHPVIDKKTQEPKKLENPDWLLFEKCIRGDKSDNIFSAYPGVRKKGTKNKTGLYEAFDDKDKKGYNWNNLMLQRWTDHNGEEHRVLDDYERNKHLIDLTAQPQEIKDKVDEAIINEVLTSSLKHMPPREISFNFMKFCGTHDLQRLSNTPDDSVNWMKKSYKGHIINLSEANEWKTFKKLERSQ
jgi:5'-3' exonuclease